ncbi:MAG: YhfC family intramembrane metalloprotease [Oscillospiraceae bacterium]
MFSTSTIAGLIICGLLCIIIPVGAVIIFKLKNREVSLLGALWGALGFIVFALVLEQISHAIMLPVVKDTVVPYVIYGVLAAGIFEETGRFVVFKTLMKKKNAPKDSIMYGLGHGGIESVMVAGTTLLSYGIMALLVNTAGLDAVLKMTGATDEATIAVATQTLEALTKQTFGMCLLSVLERLLAMTLHVSLSVWVFRAAKEKSKLWLYPAAILAHAIADVPAALGQKNIIPLWLIMTLMAILDVIFVYLASRIYKSMKKETV